MKLITFEIDTPSGVMRRAGALTDDGSAVDLQAATSLYLADVVNGATHQTLVDTLPSDLLELLRQGPPAIELAKRAIDHASSLDAGRRAGPPTVVPAGMFRLKAPLPRPPSIRDFLLVEGHVRNARKAAPPDEWYRLPVYYKGNVDATFGPEDVIPWPVFTDKLDYEIEMFAVIGREAHKVTADEALDYVVGYTIFNDWSARDIQRREMSVGLGPAIGKDFANSIGPCIVTADEFDPLSARMRARVDGEIWSEGDLSGMRFDFAEIIEWLSLEQTLHPGDLLGSGTIAGGCGLELDRWIRPGSVIELEIDGIGVLRNQIGFKPEGDVITSPKPPRRLGGQSAH